MFGRQFKDSNSEFGLHFFLSGISLMCLFADFYFWVSLFTILYSAYLTYNYRKKKCFQIIPLSIGIREGQGLSGWEINSKLKGHKR